MSRMSLENFDHDAFKKLRVKAGLSITDVAVAAKLSRGAISKWEHGLAKPTPENFHTVMKVLGHAPKSVVSHKGKESTLFDLRARAGLPRASVEKALGISRSTWGDIERGYARLSQERVPKLAKLFQVSEHLITIAAKNTSRI